MCPLRGFPEAGELGSGAGAFGIGVVNFLSVRKGKIECVLGLMVRERESNSLGWVGVGRCRGCRQIPDDTERPPRPSPGSSKQCPQ